MLRLTARFLPAVALLIALFIPASAIAADEPKPPDEDYYELYKILVDAMDQVERNYVRDIDRRELIEAAIQGVLSKLDPYSSYIGPEDMSQFKTAVESQFGGIGIQVSTVGGRLLVISPLVGTPAYRAGILAGDLIVKINGKTTKGISLDDAVRRLKGAAGTKVELTVIHPNSNDEVEIKIGRQVIRVDTVLGDHREDDDSWDYILEPEEQIGYIRITAFSRGTAQELRKAMAQLKDDEFRGLILDLRFNPGGLLSSAIEICDMFISKGRIVSTSGRNAKKRSWDARKRGTHEGFPIAVLVNRYSASASEIVSACLQDHDRAIVVGERTWGKGSVQNIIELEGGRSAMKLTTAAYQRPSGENIHRFKDADDDDEWGVIPDDGYRLRLGGGEMLALILDRKGRDVVQPHLQDAEEEPEPSAEGPADEESSDEDRADEESDEEPEEQTPTDPMGPQTNGQSAKPAETPAESENSDPDQDDPDQDDTDQDDTESDDGEADDVESDETEAEDADASDAKSDESEKFVDRQLQLAIDYLLGELAEEG